QKAEEYALDCGAFDSVVDRALLPQKINRLHMSGAMAIPARSLSSRIPPDGLTGNNPNGRRLLAEMWRPTPQSRPRKAGANIANYAESCFSGRAAGDVLRVSAPHVGRYGYRLAGLQMTPG